MLLNLRNYYSNLFKQIRDKLFLNKKISYLESGINLLLESNNIFNKISLPTINDFKLYLNILDIISKNIGIIMSVKDTPGSFMSEEIILLLKKIGFSKFKNNLWHAYIGINNNFIICDKVSGTQNESPFFKENFSNYNIVVESHPFKAENKSIISINGKDYSLNNRGLNIVIYDFLKNKVLDSISYDAHAKQDTFIRKTF